MPCARIYGAGSDVEAAIGLQNGASRSRKRHVRSLGGGVEHAPQGRRVSHPAGGDDLGPVTRASSARAPTLVSDDFLRPARVPTSAVCGRSPCANLRSVLCPPALRPGPRLAEMVMNRLGDDAAATGWRLSGVHGGLDDKLHLGPARAGVSGLRRRPPSCDCERRTEPLLGRPALATATLPVLPAAHVTGWHGAHGSNCDRSWASRGG